MLYFVAGITGRVGGAAARRLLDEGHRVRTVARDNSEAETWLERGVDVRKGDFNDADVFAVALERVDGAYLMVPPVRSEAPDFAGARALIASFVDALRQSPPPRLVVLSSVGSEKDRGLGTITSTHLLEEALNDVEFPTAFIRAGSFFENYVYSLRTATTGLFQTYLTPTDRPVPMVATADIGREVASLLVAGWDGRRIVELGSLTSPDDLARALAKVLGQPVEARSIPRDEWTATLQAQGIPLATAASFEEMEDAFNSGWIDFGVPGTESVAATTTPEQFFEDARAQMADD